ncbi:MAG: hypothetical protein ACI837_001170 [Crocinitomicaceae bacterium]|jgi:hypothetical protein
MKKNLLSLLILLGSLQTASAKAYIIAPPNYWEDSSKVDSTLNTNQAVFTFQIMNVPDLKNKVIRYSIDGVEKAGKFTGGNTFETYTTPGRHIFQFYADRVHEEVYTDSILIGSQQHIYMSVFFNAVYNDMQVRPAKPVIYLYPMEETDVTVSLDIKGTDAFLYPAYEDEWSFTAYPNGDLVFGEKTYNYLFWESTQIIQENPIDEMTGFVVEKNNVVAFLEKTLDKAGLSSKEQADFITYWAPQLVANDLNYIHFIFNDACDQFAELSISPEPDAIYRIYMLWSPLDKPIYVKEQKIETLSTDGFTVLEWGGMELPPRTINETL